MSAHGLPETGAAGPRMSQSQALHPRAENVLGKERYGEGAGNVTAQRGSRPATFPDPYPRYLKGRLLG
jgi:hypothetical protein